MRLLKKFTVALIAFALLAMSLLMVGFSSSDEALAAVLRSRVTTVYLDSYDQVPFGNLAENTVYVFPSETAPQGLTNESSSIDLLTPVITRGADMPTEVYNIFEEGRYYFAGSSSSVELYTNVRFTSKTNYTVYVNNMESHEQTVNCYRSQYNSLFYTYSVPKNSGSITTVSSGSTWFLGFPADCIVDGYVE